MNTILSDTTQRDWTLGCVAEADLEKIECPCGIY